MTKKLETFIVPSYMNQQLTRVMVDAWRGNLRKHILSLNIFGLETESAIDSFLNATVRRVRSTHERDEQNEIQRDLAEIVLKDLKNGLEKLALEDEFIPLVAELSSLLELNETIIFHSDFTPWDVPDAMASNIEKMKDRLKNIRIRVTQKLDFERSEVSRINAQGTIDTLIDFDSLEHSQMLIDDFSYVSELLVTWENYLKKTINDILKNSIQKLPEKVKDLRRNRGDNNPPENRRRSS